ncbi:hypothetical protein DPMN_068702 [Dreissena polymorpha]|uniref:Uncharacterized protein n=1 Tax=Dreissena polymorpha TaxID=45954 RepID=A0A9D3Z246_DREPO|nr:hypothetical protein DPMN_068702 [Dreissena polymorpha]
MQIVEDTLYWQYKTSQYPKSMHKAELVRSNQTGQNRTTKCWNRILKAFANSLDPDETPQNVASHQDPNCEYKPASDLVLRGVFL